MRESQFCCHRFPLGSSFVAYLDFKWQAIDDHAKGRIWHGLFMVVLHRPFRAQKVLVLFAYSCGCL